VIATGGSSSVRKPQRSGSSPRNWVAAAAVWKRRARNYRTQTGWTPMTPW